MTPKSTKNQHVGITLLHGKNCLDRYAVKLVPTGKIKPSPENDQLYGNISEETDSQLVALIASVRRVGLEEPLILTTDNYILSGHRRYCACIALGWKLIPVRFSKVSRADSTDYHRLLTEYNPQRVKSVATLLSERFIATSVDEVTVEDFNIRNYGKSAVAANFISVPRTKEFHGIGERQLEFLAAAVDAVNALKKFWPVTVRQLHYKLLNSPPLTQTTKDRNERWRYKNTKECYNALSSLLTPARYAGHVPMHAIHDPTRVSGSYEFQTAPDIAAFIAQETKSFLSCYQRHRQEGQPNHVEILCEKNTLLNIVKPVADKFHLPLSTARGYGNPSLWSKIEDRFRPSKCKRLVLLCISDHDPEGFDLIDDATRSLRDLHEVNVQAIRVALTLEQVAQQKATPSFAKESSSRFKQYVKRTGTKECWEVEALDPEFLQAELDRAVVSAMDIEQLNAVQDLQRTESVQIAKLRQRLGTGIQRLLAEGRLEP